MDVVVPLYQIYDFIQVNKSFTLLKVFLNSKQRLTVVDVIFVFDLFALKKPLELILDNQNL